MRQAHQTCIAKEKFKPNTAQESLKEDLRQARARIDVLLDKNKAPVSENKGLKAEIRQKDRQLTTEQKKVVVWKKLQNHCAKKTNLQAKKLKNSATNVKCWVEGVGPTVGSGLQ